jgi:TatD DNase family protein
MKLVDVHAHLEGSRFEKDLDEVVARFEKAGGKFIVTSGVNPETNRKSLELAEKYDIVKASFGLYPIDSIADKFEGLADDYLRAIPVFDVDEELVWIREHAKDCVAIGEIGLDFKVVKDLDNIEEIKVAQEEVFRKVLSLAKELGKTVVIHSRGAEERAIEILEEMKMEKVVMHCFSGKKALIRRIVKNGWSLSVPAVIARLDHFKMVVKMVPLNQLLTETDAPYLSPVVGERNEPANVLVTLKEIAKIKGIGVGKVAARVLGNAEKLFEF